MALSKKGIAIFLRANGGDRAVPGKDQGVFRKVEKMFANRIDLSAGVFFAVRAAE